MLEQSNWEIQKSKSEYHFDNTRMDPRWDTVRSLGHLVGDWTKEVQDAIESAEPKTWRNRSKTGKPNKLVDAEEYDLANIGADPDMVFSHLEYKLAPIFQQMSDIIGLDNREARVHVQWPGQVFVRHIDKLEKFNPEDPSKVIRVMVMLTDWDQGHFNQYGNYTYQGWKAGEIHTFDWKNVPHSSANSGLTPRVSLLTTGVITAQTEKFLSGPKEINVTGN
jgi:hypothetical protein